MGVDIILIMNRNSILVRWNIGKWEMLQQYNYDIYMLFLFLYC